MRSLAVIYTEEDRQRILAAVRAAPIGSRVDIKGPKRTLPQNDRMWAMLSDIVKQQKTIDGQTFSTDEWKAIFLQALGHEPDMLPTLDGRGFFAVNHSSSSLSKDGMSALIEYIFAWGAENGVVWSDPNLRSQEEMMR